MSETDDTEILLLIPPNFFLVRSSESEDSLLESSRTVVHKPQSCTSQVLEKLVTQVHFLENRLESLELSTVSDSISSRDTLVFGNKTWDYSQNLENQNFDRKCFTFPRRRKRKIAPRRHKRRELSFTSLESSTSRCKDIPPLALRNDHVRDTAFNKEVVINDSPSMDGDLSSIVSTPSKKNDKLLLHEIDEFLHKVEVYESPESNVKSQEPALSPENVIRATSNYITNKLDARRSEEKILPSGKAIPSIILDKYIYLAKNNQSESNQSDQTNYGSQSKGLTTTNLKNESYNPRHPDTFGSNQDQASSKSPVVRKINFLDNNKEVQPTSTPKRHIDKQTSLSYTTDAFRPSTNKIYDSASKVLEQYKTNYNTNIDNTIDTSLLNSATKEDFKLPQCRPYLSEHRVAIETCRGAQKLMDSIDTELLSLSDLWGAKGERADSGKLEEERLKREHCEAMIQDLQKKLLDQQEKLAVAMKVDRSKDSAISKLREAWIKITTSLERSEIRHKAALDKMVHEVEHYKMVASDAQKKTQHFEGELYKTLDLAHDYQEKCKRTSKERQEMEENMKKSLLDKDEIIKSKNEDINNLKDNYDTVIRLNKQSSECTKNLENALEKEKLEHNNTRTKLVELNRRTENIHGETTMLIQERDLLKDKVNEERARNGILERQIAEKQNLLDAMQKRQDTVDNEILSLRKAMELQKNELKCHYQKQLEEAVLCKLQEFQQQLDHAEREMEGDARVKENTIMDTYNKQMLRIEEQHKLEIEVLEDKHKEEMKLYRLQLAQAGEKITLLESKLDTYRRRRGQIASQLHNVMESQWRQALHILSTPSRDHSADITTASTPVAQDYAPPKMPPLAMPTFAGGAGGAAGERLHNDNMLHLEGLSDHELQQYVKLLLTKPPMDGGGDAAHKVVPEEPTSDRPDHGQERAKDRLRRTFTAHKPPWKS